MTRFYVRLLIYYISFAISLYGLSALDFNRFLKPNRPRQAQILYLLLAMIMAYLFGEFVMKFMIYFQL